MKRMAWVDSLLYILSYMNLVPYAITTSQSDEKYAISVNSSLHEWIDRTLPSMSTSVAYLSMGARYLPATLTGCMQLSGRPSNCMDFVFQ